MPRNQTRKSDANSRERLLEAAVDVFGKRGYEAATTRMIAKTAGVNVAAIPYYFNGKDGLYQAVVTYIVEKIEEKAGAAFQNTIAPASEKGLSRDTALSSLEDLLGTLVNFLVGSPEAARVARIILREQLDPSSAYDIIYSRFMTRIINSIAAFLMVILGDISLGNARLRAMSMMGQVMAFRMARETIVRMVGFEGYNQDETDEIRSIVLEHTRGIIESLGRHQTD